MFFVGNQVPCVVLGQLMKQTFFQEVIAKGRWSIPLGELPKMALYLLVVLPHLVGKKAPYVFREEPSDLLHAFRCLVLGPGIGNYHIDDDDEHDSDLEAGTEEEDTNSRDLFPSATELEQSGIKLVNVEGGIREICFRHLWLFHGRLYVPPFTFGSNPELIFRYLKEYEIAQNKARTIVVKWLRTLLHEGSHSKAHGCLRSSTQRDHSKAKQDSWRQVATDALEPLL